MKILTTALLVINLSGCAGIARMYDMADDCQTRPELNRPQGYKAPDWCGASSGRTYIYNNQSQRIGYIK
jgi:hypothetical protein